MDSSVRYVHKGFLPRAQSPSTAEARHARTLLTHNLLQAPKSSLPQTPVLRLPIIFDLSFVHLFASETQLDPSHARHSLR